MDSRRKCLQAALVFGIAFFAASRGVIAQPRTPLVGFLAAGTPDGWAHLIAAFNEGLKEQGYRDGENIKVEYRWAQGKFDRLSTLAAELVNQRVSAILAGGGLVTALRAKEATSTIPVVFVMGNDPVQGGIVQSLSRPGGNITGVTLFSAELGAKRVELLRQLVPGNPAIGLLENPKNPNLPAFMQGLQEAVRLGQQELIVVHATNDKEITAAFASLTAKKVGALLVSPDPYFNSNRTRVVSLSTQHKIPTIYTLADYTRDGGLMSYGSSFAGGYQQAGVYVGRILKGEKPADLPILQPTKFELTINLKAAAGLGLTVPPSLLLRADRVIE